MGVFNVINSDNRRWAYAGANKRFKCHINRTKFDSVKLINVDEFYIVGDYL
jgi:hypothetical protein